jgi:hypothetical protein
LRQFSLSFEKFGSRTKVGDYESRNEKETGEGSHLKLKTGSAFTWQLQTKLE